MDAKLTLNIDIDIDMDIARANKRQFSARTLNPQNRPYNITDLTTTLRQNRVCQQGMSLVLPQQSWV